MVCVVTHRQVPYLLTCTVWNNYIIYVMSSISYDTQNVWLEQMVFVLSEMYTQSLNIEGRTS